MYHLQQSSFDYARVLIERWRKYIPTSWCSIHNLISCIYWLDSKIVIKISKKYTVLILFYTDARAVRSIYIARRSVLVSAPYITWLIFVSFNIKVVLCSSVWLYGRSFTCFTLTFSTKFSSKQISKSMQENCYFSLAKFEWNTNKACYAILFMEITRIAGK